MAAVSTGSQLAAQAVLKCSDHRDSPIAYCALESHECFSAAVSARISADRIRQVMPEPRPAKRYLMAASRHLGHRPAHHGPGPRGQDARPPLPALLRTPDRAAAGTIGKRDRTAAAHPVTGHVPTRSRSVAIAEGT
jgi:hypothetical protein